MAERTEKLLGREFRKIQPKLRMFAKAKDPVNTVRSDFASAMKVDAKALDGMAKPREHGTPAAKKLKAEATGMSRGQVSAQVKASVFVTRDSDSDPLPPALTAVRSSRDGTLLSGTVKLSDLPGLAEAHGISFVELGEPLRAPDAAVGDESNAPRKTDRLIAEPGGGVIVGIIDVEGFDFSHKDFLDANGDTRWIGIWDQGDGGMRDEPRGYSYGSEINQDHMNAAIAASKRPDTAAAPWALEPQTQMAPGSHGTHVASIAAGNKGVCRTAYVAGVMISLPRDEASDRRLSFYDSTRIADAVDYLLALGELADLPVSINISLGTNGGGHDASNAISRWIDSALTVPGRSVCVAAGNAGQEKAEHPDDIGFINGRIHTSGRIEARGLNSDIEWVVVGNGIADVSENELEIWYSGSDRFAVSITPPGMETIGPIEPRQYYQNEQLDDDSFLSAYNELYHPANGLNYIAIYLSPFLRRNPVVGARPGVWKVRLHGREVRDGRYDGWIERDDPRRRGVDADRQLWNFPSFFTEASNVDDSSVSSLACGQRVLSVANLDLSREKINISSSQGPTRDERFKPDLAAPGTDIVAANGFVGDDDSWVAMTGTSMASPYVAGVVGVMLAAAPRLTAAQICGIMHRTAQPLPGRNFEWANDSGYGVVSGEECLTEARNIDKRSKLNP